MSLLQENSQKSGTAHYGKDTSDTTMTLPAVIQFKDGTSAILSAEVNETKTGKSFWLAIKKKLQGWTKILGDEGFQVIGDTEKHELQVLAYLLPGLLGIDGKLAYNEASGRILKPDYKPFLEQISMNVNQLLKYHKSEVIRNHLCRHQRSLP